MSTPNRYVKFTFISSVKQQTLNVQGPKVQLEIQLGAVNVFVTPRQLHALIYLSNLFLDDTSTQQNNRRNDDTADDLERGSQYKQFSGNAMSGHLGFNQGWSSDPMCKFQSHCGN